MDIREKLKGHRLRRLRLKEEELAQKLVRLTSTKGQ